MHDPSRTYQELIEESFLLKKRIQELEESEKQLKLTKEALKKSEELFRKAFHTNQDSININRLADGRYVSINEGFTRITGYTKADVIGKTSIELNIWDDLTDRQRLVEGLKKDGEVNDLEAIFRKKDGSSIHGSISASVIDLDGVPHLLNVTRDITEHKRAENALRESEQKYRLLANRMTDAVWISDLNFNTTFVSPSAEYVLGVPPEERMKIPFEDQVTPETYTRVMERLAIEMAMEESAQSDPDRTLTMEMEYYHRNGSIVWMENIVSAIRNADGQLIGLQGVARDITDRKQAEEKLREGTNRLHLAAVAAKAGVWDWNLQMNEMIWDDRMLELYGLTHENFPGGIEAWEQGLHPDDSSRAIEEFQVALRGERDFDTEFRVRRPDGTVVHIRANGLVLRDEKGQALRMIGLNTDITERKQVDEEIRRRDSKYRELVEHAQDGIFTITVQGQFLLVNTKFCQMLDYTLEECLRRNILDTYPDDMRPVGTQRLADLQSGQALRFERPMKRQDGGIVFVEAIAWKDSDGNVQAIVRDITDRKRTEEDIQANEARIRAVYDSVQDFIFIKDANRRYLVINNFFQKRFQVDPSVFLGHTDTEIPIFENKDMTEAIVQETDAIVLRGETAHFELMHRVCGTLLTLDILKTPILDRRGNVTGICGVSRDITERRKVEEEKRGLEERLNRAEKMESLGTLAGGVAHDLNNVLGIVVGYAEMLMDEMDEANPMRSDLKKILEGGNRSAAIVQDLLTLARRGVQTKKTVNLNATITDCQKLPEFEKIFSCNRQVKLQTDLESDLLNITGSPVHLAKSIINLAANAVEAMPNGGVLKIATANQYLDVPIHGYDKIREGDYVVLTVSDTGEGILERDIKRIFEPFYTKKIMGRSGTGLGLAVVWGTIKDHNGYINVESEEGKGTTFTIYLPVTREEIASDQFSVSMSEYVGKGETILVVDDINRQRELASRMLTKLNYKVTTVASGEEAVEYLRTNKADLIVLDMIMDPGIDGLETYEKILENNPVQKAVIVSGFSESDRVRKAQKIGAGTYVPKPYVLERLGMAARKELDRK